MNIDDKVDRTAAMELLWSVLERTANVAEHADIEAWIDARGEDEGGFLWLIGQLSCRPLQIEAQLRGLMAAGPRERSFLRQRVRAARRAHAKAFAG